MKILITILLILMVSGCQCLRPDYDCVDLAEKYQDENGGIKVIVRLRNGYHMINYDIKKKMLIDKGYDIEQPCETINDIPNITPWIWGTTLRYVEDDE